MKKDIITTELVRTIKRRLLQMHFESGVGHIGGNLSCLDAMLVVHHEYLSNRDRFILSKGHSAGALYVTLWSLGRLQDADLKTFHKEATLLAGHPPAAGIPEILFATGSLGHGLSLAAGTALALKLKNNTDVKEVQPSHVYCLTSDGEWQEGATWEALIFATHHKLNNLTVLVDHNRLQGFGDTESIASMSPLAEKIRGFDADIFVINGHNLPAIRSVLDETSEKCRIIILNTKKGNGVSFMEDKMEWHYLPLTKEQFEKAISELEIV